MIFHELEDHTVRELVDHLTNRYQMHRNAADDCMHNGDLERHDHNMERAKYYGYLRYQVIEEFNDNSDGEFGSIRSEKQEDVVDVVPHQPVCYVGHLGATEG